MVGITTLWVILSTIGLTLSTYELVKSFRSFRDVRNKYNGRRVVARDMFIRAVFLALLFLDFTCIGIVSHILVAGDFTYATQEAIRQGVTRPAIVMAVVLLIGKLVSSTYARIRLEEEDKRWQKKSLE